MNRTHPAGLQGALARVGVPESEDPHAATSPARSSYARAAAAPPPTMMPCSDPDAVAISCAFVEGGPGKRRSGQVSGMGMIRKRPLGHRTRSRRLSPLPHGHTAVERDKLVDEYSAEEPLCLLVTGLWRRLGPVGGYGTEDPFAIGPAPMSFPLPLGHGVVETGIDPDRAWAIGTEVLASGAMCKVKLQSRLVGGADVARSGPCGKLGALYLAFEDALLPFWLCAA